jgi:hypothetical protein
MKTLNKIALTILMTLTLSSSLLALGDGPSNPGVALASQERIYSEGISSTEDYLMEVYLNELKSNSKLKDALKNLVEKDYDVVIELLNKSTFDNTKAIIMFPKVSSVINSYSTRSSAALYINSYLIPVTVSRPSNGYNYQLEGFVRVETEIYYGGDKPTETVTIKHVIVFK